MNIEQLAVLFQHTHAELQMRASRSVDVALVIRNWLFGWYIGEFEKMGNNRAEYGSRLLKQLAQKLEIRGCSERNLASFCKFYRCYADSLQAVAANSSMSEISLGNILQALPAKSEKASKRSPQAVAGESFATAPVLKELFEKLASLFSLGWTHYVVLMTIKKSEERRFYEIESVQNSWGYRELERQINSSLYERLALSRDKDEVRRLCVNGQVIEKPSDVIKNPYILEFTGLEEKPSYSEHELESAVINRLEQFLLELGKGFLFEARQKRFTFDHNHFYVDMVFYNRLLRCYVLIDLKIGEIKHQDLGQMQMYVNYFDRYVKNDDEFPSIGILLCHTKSDDVVELTLPKDSNIFASQYELYLPSKDELKKQLATAMEEMEV
jgi:predicted nuclease of restriction endonuclease-like (RecB) superfamily